MHKDILNETIDQAMKRITDEKEMYQRLYVEQLELSQKLQNQLNTIQNRLGVFFN